MRHRGARVGEEAAARARETAEHGSARRSTHRRQSTRPAHSHATRARTTVASASSSADDRDVERLVIVEPQVNGATERSSLVERVVERGRGEARIEVAELSIAVLQRERAHLRVARRRVRPRTRQGWARGTRQGRAAGCERGEPRVGQGRDLHRRALALRDAEPRLDATALRLLRRARPGRRRRGAEFGGERLGRVFEEGTRVGQARDGRVVIARGASSSSSRVGSPSCAERPRSCRGRTRTAARRRAPRPTSAARRLSQPCRARRIVRTRGARRWRRGRAAARR